MSRKPRQRTVYGVKVEVPRAATMRRRHGKWWVDPSGGWFWSHDSDFPVCLCTKPNWLDHAHNKVFAAIARAELERSGVHGRRARAWQRVYEKACAAEERHRAALERQRERLEERNEKMPTCGHKQRRKLREGRE